MLKKSASGVLASLRGSTYRKEYASPLRLLRPCWTDFLSILEGDSFVIPHVRLANFAETKNRFPQPGKDRVLVDRTLDGDYSFLTYNKG